MSTYVLVSFWLTALASAIRLFELMFRAHWPVEKKVGLGEHIASILIGAGFLFWAGYLLWWGPL